MIFLCLFFIFCGTAPTERYQVIGRKVHMDFVREHFTAERNVDFGDTQERPNNIELEILADTVYVKVRYKNFLT